MRKAVLIAVSLVFLAGCFSNKAQIDPGPDQQSGGFLSGMIIGAGTGAVTGASFGSAAAGPGTAIGAGLGAVAGSLKGALGDTLELQKYQLQKEIKRQRGIAVAHEQLADHFARRAELFPSRDIFPADLFFYADSSRLSPAAKVLASEIAVINKERLPWSRLAITSYIKTGEKEGTSYAKRLASERSKAIMNAFVRAGIEPRRIEARVVFLDEPLVIDPLDSPFRYSQAIEFIPLDR